MNYDKLIKQGLMSASVASMLFGQDEERMEELEYEYAYPSLAFDISLFYTALVQAYTFARLLKSGTTLSQTKYPMLLRKNIKSAWPCDDKGAAANGRSVSKEWVYSFLTISRALGKDVFDGPDDIIRKAEGSLEKTKQLHYDAALSESDFVTYIKSLPLLRNTDIDFNRMRFIFKYTDESGASATAEIDCRPFLFFWNDEKEIWVKEQTPVCYVMTSVSRGERGGELFVNLMQLNNPDSSTEASQIRWQASKNETVRMIFQSLEIPGDWLAIDEFWCDFAFMQKLARAFEGALGDFWELCGMERESDISARLHELFEDKDIRDSLKNQHWHRNEVIRLENVDKMFFGLFIKYGFFRTVRCIFFTKNDDALEDKRMSRLLDSVLMNLLSDKNAVKSYVSECDDKISAHIEALKKKIPYESSSLFKNRRREIISEWRAFTVLKAAGIHSDNLFIDREVMYSIDDYHLMVKSNETPLEDDLRRVMRLLIELYEPLTDVCCLDRNGTLNESCYYSHLWQLKDEIADCDLGTLFERFYRIVKNSENSPTIKTLLGRNAICNKDIYDRYAKAILEQLKRDHESKPSSFLTDRYIFISYAHKDDKDNKSVRDSKEAELNRISAVVDKWTKLGYRTFFDKKDFDGGNDWEMRAKNAIQSEKCAGVVVFMSPTAAVSAPIASELQWAYEEASKRFGGQYDKITRFIIPVNLEEDTMIDDYLKELERGNTKDSSVALRIRKHLPDSKLYRNYSAYDIYTDDVRKLLTQGSEIHRRLCKNEYNKLELQIVNFYAFLKFGDDAKWKDTNMIDDYIRGDAAASMSMAHCIYPIVVSMRETKIRRDNITMVAYETTSSREDGDKSDVNYILTSKPLTNPDDYYCIPHYSRVSDDCNWMIDPLLISFKKMTER